MTDTMRAAVVPEAGGDFELEERPVPEPEPGEVRVAVDACGICHSDVFVKERARPGIEFALDEVEAAYDRMIDNEARFRVVLEP